MEYLDIPHFLRRDQGFTMGLKAKPSAQSPCAANDSLAKEAGWKKKGRLWVKPDPDRKRSRKNANTRPTNH